MKQTKCSCGAELKVKDYDFVLAHIHGTTHLADSNKILSLKRAKDAWNWVILDRAETVQFEKLYGNVRIWKHGKEENFVVDLLTYFAGTMRKSNPFGSFAFTTLAHKATKEGFLPSLWSANLSVILPQETRYRCTFELLESDVFKRDFEDNAYEIASFSKENTATRQAVLGRLEDFFCDALNASNKALYRSLPNRDDAKFLTQKPTHYSEGGQAEFHILQVLKQINELSHMRLTTHLLAVIAGEIRGVSPFARNDWTTFEPWFEALLVSLVEAGIVKPVGAMTEAVPTVSVLTHKHLPTHGNTVLWSRLGNWKPLPVRTQGLEINPSKLSEIHEEYRYLPLTRALREQNVVCMNLNEVDYAAGFAAMKKSLAYKIKPVPSGKQTDIYDRIE